MNKYIKKISIASGVLALASVVQAKDTSTSGYSDLILGFYAAAGTGAATNLEVNLGDYSAFAKKDGLTFTVPELLVSDLTATYGSGTGNTLWNGAGHVTWGVVGSVDQQAFVSAAGSLPQSTVFITSTSTPASNFTSTLDGASSNITGLYNGLAGFGLVPSTQAGNIHSATMAVGSSANGSWTGQLTNTSPAFDTFSFSPTTGTDTSTLNLYMLVASNAALGDLTVPGISRGVNLLGSFNLAPSGVLTFTAAGTAIPEPSSYAAIAGVAMLGFVAARRRRTVKA